MLIFTFVKNCTKFTVLLLASSAAVGIFATPAEAEWKVDFSRRTRAIRETDLHDAGTAAAYSQGYQGDRAPASAQPVNPPDVAPLVEAKESQKGVFDTLFDAGEPVQDLVILHTEKGFIPQVVRVRKGGRYRVTVVNVNEKEKNVSFILDGFSEHHATYYGKQKTFLLEAKKEGQFSFQSPETSSEGKLIVFNPQITLRNPASSNGESAK